VAAWVAVVVAALGLGWAVQGRGEGG